MGLRRLEKRPAVQVGDPPPPRTGSPIPIALFWLLGLFGWLFIPAPLAWAGETILVRVTQFPPQYYQDILGRWTGLDAALGQALVEGAGMEVEFVDLPWSRALKEMESGGVHLMMNLSITEERSRIMRFIGPERPAVTGLAVQKAHADLIFRGLDDLVAASEATGLKIGIQQDAQYTPEFTTRLKTEKRFAAAFEPVVRAEHNFRKLAAGRLFGFFEDQYNLAHRIRTDPLCAGLSLHSFILMHEKVYFGASRTLGAPIIERLEGSYRRLEEDGTLERIRQTPW
jgi:ABC-type amino acid transport substrate-binding protein